MKTLAISILALIATGALATIAGAADSGGHLSAATKKTAPGAPLHFSLTVMPVQSDFNGIDLVSPSILSKDGLVNHASPPLSSAPAGIKIDTGLAAGPISGGLTYLKGAAARADNFSNWYAASPRADLGLQPVFILPSEYLDSYTTLNSSGASDQSEGLAIHGGYELTPNLQINGAFLVAKSSQLSKDDLGGKTEKTNWRLDLGGAYKFKDNITYSINFGYLDGADSFNKGNSSSWQGNSAYVVKHQLNMSF